MSLMSYVKGNYCRNTQNDIESADAGKTKSYMWCYTDDKGKQEFCKPVGCDKEKELCVDKSTASIAKRPKCDPTKLNDGCIRDVTRCQIDGTKEEGLNTCVPVKECLTLSVDGKTKTGSV